MPEDGPKAVWLQVKDDDEWVPCTVAYGGGGKSQLTRMYTPANEPKVVTLDDAAVAKLRPAVGDLSVPGPDLVWLEDVHESTMLHNLRLRYAQDKIYSERRPASLLTS